MYQFGPKGERHGVGIYERCKEEKGRDGGKIGQFSALFLHHVSSGSIFASPNLIAGKSHILQEGKKVKERGEKQELLILTSNGDFQFTLVGRHYSLESFNSFLRFVKSTIFR